MNESVRLARPEGFEPPTPRFVVWCSVQLSYGRTIKFQITFCQSEIALRVLTILQTKMAEREGFEPSVPFWGTHA
jgi:hypothetical protein